MIVIDNFGKVKCGQDANSLKECNPIELFAACAECGDCPIIGFGEEYMNVCVAGII